MHEHFDAAGNPTGHTVVTREPRVTAKDREQMLGLDDYERTKCGCGCGQPIAECTDKKRVFEVDVWRCNAGRALDIARRNAAKQAEDEGYEPGWDDGLHYYISNSYEYVQEG